MRTVPGLMPFEIAKINAQLFANGNTCGMKRTHLGCFPEGLNGRAAEVGWRVLPAGSYGKVDHGMNSKISQPA